MNLERDRSGAPLRSNDDDPGPVSPDRYMSQDAMAAVLTRLELGITRLSEAFASWALELQKHVSGKQLSFQEVSLLHCTRLRGGTTTLAEMMIFQHRHDIAAINYSLRKLEHQGLIKRVKGPYRREVGYTVTELGRKVTDAYGQLRQQVLVQLCKDVVGMQAATNDAAAVMERMIGIYDQATQAILNQPLIETASAQPQDAPPPPAPAVSAVPQPATGRPVARRRAN
jgi:predicted MarR family transcription regulator